VETRVKAFDSAALVKAAELMEARCYQSRAYNNFPTENSPNTIAVWGANRDADAARMMLRRVKTGALAAYSVRKSHGLEE
jgi:hypothetical protein